LSCEAAELFVGESCFHMQAAEGEPMIRVILVPQLQPVEINLIAVRMEGTH
jgi:hypothetical protein